MDINQIHHGDCLELMHEIPDGSVDMVLADLPYGTTACAWDSIIPLEPLWAHYKRIIKPRGAIVLTASQPFTTVLINAAGLDWLKYEWCWNKKLATDFLNAKNKPMKLHENILVFSSGTVANGSENKMVYNPQMWQSESYFKTRGKDPRIGAWERGNRTPFELSPVKSDGERYPVSIVEFSNADRFSKVHPTQKPVALFAYLINTYSNPGDLVLDNTAGSGTTAIAAIQTGRNWLCIEKDAEIYATAANRIAKALGQDYKPKPVGENQPTQAALF